MAAGGADAADPTGRRPARHGLWIDPEQTGNLSGSEESIAVLHLMCLSSGLVLSSALAGPQPDVYTLRAPASAFDLRKLRCEQKFRAVVNVRSLSVTKLGRNCIFWREESPHDHGAQSGSQCATDPPGRSRTHFRSHSRASSGPAAWAAVTSIGRRAWPARASISGGVHAGYRWDSD